MGRHTALTRQEARVILRCGLHDDGVARDVAPMLAERLERAGLVVRHYVPRGPLRQVNVTLTDAGHMALALLQRPPT